MKRRFVTRLEYKTKLFTFATAVVLGGFIGGFTNMGTGIMVYGLIMLFDILSEGRWFTEEDA